MHGFQVRDIAHRGRLNRPIWFLCRPEVCNAACAGLHMQVNNDEPGVASPEPIPGLVRFVLRGCRDGAEHHGEFPDLRDRPGQLGGLVAARVVPRCGPLCAARGPNQRVSFPPRPHETRRVCTRQVRDGQASRQAHTDWQDSARGQDQSRQGRWL